MPPACNDSFTIVDAEPQSEWPNYSPSNLPSVATSRQPSEIGHPPPSTDSMTLSAMQQILSAEAGAQEAQLPVDRADDSLAFEHIESFNILCVGESGLGKSTFLRDVFAHLDPTKIQDMKRRVAEQTEVITTLQDKIRRNEQESKASDDERALHLRDEKTALKADLQDAIAKLGELRERKRSQEQAVAVLRGEIQRLEETVKELRSRRDSEDDDEEARRLGREVISLQDELKQRRAELAAEVRRTNLDRSDDEQTKQTTEVAYRLIKEMPLYDGARQGLDVTLIDTPGYGDLVVDKPGNASADKVCAEVNARIKKHLNQKTASRPGMSLDKERMYWNDLVHLCLFFISPHRMKRADVDLMLRLHSLVPLVVVIAKSDTMTREETREFKTRVAKQLGDEGVTTFSFDQKMVKEVEELHIAQSSESFQPLYGGADGKQPWAIMGADESRREYIWGTAVTNDPRHSELPALRDLVLRMGGWKELKSAAAFKADAQRNQQASLAGAAMSMLGGRLPRRQLMLVALVAVAAIAGAVLTPAVSTVSGMLDSSAQVAAENARLLDDLGQCTQVRQALERDLEIASKKHWF